MLHARGGRCRDWSAALCLVLWIARASFAQSTQCNSASQPASATDSMMAESAPPQSAPTDASQQLMMPRTPILVPPRPPPLIEIGNRFFGTGPLEKGITLPTGAVWTPSFIVFGTYRSVVQAFEQPFPLHQHVAASEWANRLDIYGNLQLTGTERILIGFRPLDDGVFAKPALAKYSGYQFNPEQSQGWVGKFNVRPTTAFFEGEIDQLFPGLNPIGNRPTDVGFSVGRQPLLYQGGALIDDDIDAVGVTRNTFIPRGATNAQITAIYGWEQINRGDGINHHDHALIGLFLNADIRPTTWDLDFAYVSGHSQHTSGFYAGLSATQRIGFLNTTFRALSSKALGHPSPGPNSALSQLGNGESAIGNGALLISELSYTLPYSDDLLYLDSFWGIDRFTSAARGPDRGGALASVGILFAEQPIGRFGSALSSSPEKAVGTALGLQKFLDPRRRKQLILEVGGREQTQTRRGAIAGAARYQQAFGQHTVLQLDSFASLVEGHGAGFGGRIELRIEF